jgi:hypothetical protein
VRRRRRQSLQPHRPLQTFAGAISKTAPFGEINRLDPGGFGAVTITKSIIIFCEVGTAGVLVAGNQWDRHQRRIDRYRLCARTRLQRADNGRANTTGVSAGGGATLASYGNNQLTGNTTDGTPAAITLP